MSNLLPVVRPLVKAQLHDALKMTDEVAFFNVTHDNEGRSILNDAGVPISGFFPRGGPFGAALAISYGDTLEVIGIPRGNNVVGSGIASKHAEDQALLPDNYQSLVERLSSFKAASQEVTVWMISSGQSCTTCHTKQEIMARDLIGRGLIGEGHFATLYGATYDQTFQVAQFYDAQYADAMILFANDPENAANLIRAGKKDFTDIPQEVQEIMKSAQVPTSVVVRNGKVYSVGTESRGSFDLNSTSEVSAVRGACARMRTEEGAFASWEVEGELYTTSLEVGPLLFAEAGWTKINRVHHVVMPENLCTKQFDVRETSGLNNTEFLQIIAGGYHDERAAIAVLRDRMFENKGQPMWARMLVVNGQILYNSASVSPAVLAMRDVSTRFRFAAADLCDQGRTSPNCPVPLLALGEFMRPIST